MHTTQDCGSFPSSVFNVITETIREGEEKSKQEWMLSSTLGTDLSLRMSIDPQNLDHSFVPWGSVALPICSDEYTDFHCRQSEVEKQLEGRAFCFLPLPVLTRLPVHVNGYFDLAANRRDLWFGSDLCGEALTRAEWNKALLSDAVAEAYIRALVEAKDLVPPKEFYALWPSNNSTEPYNYLVTALYRNLYREDVLALHVPEERTSLHSSSTRTAPKKFVSPEQALHCSTTEATRWSVTASELSDSTDDVMESKYIRKYSLCDVLASVQLPVACVPEYVSSMFVEATGEPIRMVTPALIRDILRHPAFNGFTSRRGTTLKSLSSAGWGNQLSRLIRTNHDAALVLLEYVVSDLNPGDLSELWGIQLLPTSDRTLAMFLPNKSSDCPIVGEVQRVIYRCTPEEKTILFKFPDKVIAARLPNAPSKLLGSEEASLQLNLERLTAQAVIDMLPDFLGDKYRGSLHERWDVCRLLCPEDWLRQFWAYIKASGCDFVPALSQWPLIPSENGFLCGVRQESCVIDTEGTILATQPNSKGKALRPMTTPCKRFLTKHGCFALDQTFKDVLPEFLVTTEVISVPEITAVLKTLTSAVSSHENTWMVPNLDDECIAAFLEFCCDRCHDLHSEGLSDATKQTLQRLRFIPVWKPQNEVGNSSSYKFVSLSKGSVCFAPLATDVQFLQDLDFTKGQLFIKSNWPGLPDFLGTIGMTPMSLPLFASQHAMRVLGDTTCNSMSSDDVQRRVSIAKIILNALRDVTSSSCSDDNCKESLLLQAKTIRWIPSTSGFLSAPEVMLFPDVVEICFRGPPLTFVHDDLLTEYREQLVFVGVNNELSTNIVSLLLSYFQRRDSSVEGPEVQTRKVSIAKALLHHIDSHFWNLFPEGKYPEVIQKLYEAPWLPVLTSPPKGIVLWNSQWRSCLFAAPKDTRPVVDAELVSSSMRLTECCPKSEPLNSLFAWNHPPPGVAIAKQLVSLLRSRQTVVDHSAKDVSDIFNKAMCLFQGLQTSFEEATFGGVFEVLKGKAVLPVNRDTYIPLSWVACADSIVVEPLLYQLPVHLRPFQSMLLKAGVCDSFGSNDIVSALERMKVNQRKNTTPLSTEDIHRSLKLLQQLSAIWTNKNVQRISIYAPDVSGWLISSENLLYNDAPFVNPTSDNIPGRLIHPAVPNYVAESLGVGSLRLAIQSEDESEKLGCPQHSQISDRLNDLSLVNEDAPWKVLLGLVELADLLHANSVEVTFDRRIHPDQSLLSPALKATVGPSLMVCIHGVKVSPRELVEYLTLNTEDGILQGKQHVCCGLLPCFSITDCLQIVSGRDLAIFDPLGCYLGCTSAESGSIARSYKLSDRILQFVDQFAPFERAGFGFRANEEFDGTIIRLPLRPSEATGVIKYTPNGDAIGSVMKEFALHVRNSLVFMVSIVKLSVSVWNLNAKEAVFHLRCELGRDSAGLEKRQQIFYSTDWKKPECVVDWLGVGSVLQQNAFTVTLKTRISRDVLRLFSSDIDDDSSYERTWLVSQTLGSGKTQQFALENESLGPVCPFAAVAMPIRTSADDSLEVQKGVPELSDLDPVLYAHVPVFSNKTERCNSQQVIHKSDQGPHVIFNGGFTVRRNRLVVDFSDVWNRELRCCIVDAYIAMVRLLPSIANLYQCYPRLRCDVLPTAVSIKDNQLQKGILHSFYNGMANERLFEVNIPFKRNEHPESVPECVVISDGYVLGSPEVTENVENFVSVHFKVLIMPSNVLNAIRESSKMGPKIRLLSPKMIRDFLKSALSRQVDLNSPEWAPLKDPHAAADILRFAMSDEIPDPINPDMLNHHSKPRDGTAIASAARSLQGLRVLPLSDGRFVRIGEKSYIVASPSERALVSGAEKEFVHPLCASLRCFRDPSFVQALKLKSFNSDSLQSVMQGRFDESSIPSAEWLREFWRHVNGETANKFGNYSLLPLTDGRVVKVHTLTSTVVFPYMECDVHAIHALERVGCQVVAHQFAYSFVDPRIARSSVRKKVIFALKEANTRGMLQFDELRRVDAWALLSFFASFEEPLSCKEISILRELPLLEDMASAGQEDPDFIAVNWRDNVYVAPSDPIFTSVLDNRFVRGWLHADLIQDLRKTQPSEAEVKYLRDNQSSVQELLKTIGVRFADDCEMLYQFAFDPQHYDTLPLERKLDFIVCVKNNWNCYKSHETFGNLLQERLRKTKCAPLGASSGIASGAATNVVLPSTLVDNRVPLFRTIYGGRNNRRLVPSPYNSTPWLEFFADLGMKTEVTTETFLDCARFVSSLGDKDIVSASVCKKAEALLIYFKDNLNTLHPSTVNQRTVDHFYEELSEISIVPIVPPNVDSVKPTGNTFHENVEYRLAPLKDCIIPDTFFLGWLAAPVIPTSCVPPHCALHKLRVKTPIPPCIVIENLQLLGSSVELGKLPRQPLEEVVDRALAYFSEKWDDLRPAEKDVLRGIPLIPIGDAMYPAGRVVRGLVSADQYAPILRKLPGPLERHDALLEKLGMVMKTTPKRLARMTMELLDEFGAEPLNICEVRALANLHKLILANPDADEIQDRDWLLHDRDVAVQVPTEDSVLASARNCFFDDMPWLLSRIHRK
eukprot:Rmarinus@m.11043